MLLAVAAAVANDFSADFAVDFATGLGAGLTALAFVVEVFVVEAFVVVETFARVAGLRFVLTLADDRFTAADFADFFFPVAGFFFPVPALAATFFREEWAAFVPLADRAGALAFLAEAFFRDDDAARFFNQMTFACRETETARNPLRHK